MSVVAGAASGQLARLSLGLLATGFAGLAAVLGWHHPVAPLLVCLGLWWVAMGSVWRPGAWLFWLPALLPLLNFSPWTGWWLLDESDLFVLAVLAGGYARWAMEWRAPARRALWPGWTGPRTLGWLCLLLAVTLVLGAWRGWVAGGGGSPWTAEPVDGLYADYDSAWNTLRVGKSLLWALLLLPLLQQARAVNAAGAGTAWARGMVAGLALVCLVVLWERHVYVGALDFVQPYRTSAWFWEMHVGGGAIDAYLALAAPFALWAVWTAPTPSRWMAANGLLWLTVYVVLTTYARGIYLALLISLAFMLVSAWRLNLRPAAGAAWQQRAVVGVLVALGVQSALVLGSGAFMADRLAQANTDLVGRLAHWQAGLNLLKTPADWALGLGLGRLPSRYSHEAPDGSYPGRAVWATDAQGRGHVQLSGPLSRAELARYFALTQRIALDGGGRYRIRVLLQPDVAGRLELRLCERHLLYNGACQWRTLSWKGSEQADLVWLEARLNGQAFSNAGHGWLEPGGVLAISPALAGQQVRLYAVELFDPSDRQVLNNTDFAQRMQHWLPAARGHFLPWHMDNAYLEVLVERGALGLLAMVFLLVWAAWNLWRGLKARDALAWVLAASLLGMLALGMVISVMEVPRVALILWLLLWQTRPNRGQIDDMATRNGL